MRVFTFNSWPSTDQLRTICGAMEASWKLRIKVNSSLATQVRSRSTSAEISFTRGSSSANMIQRIRRVCRSLNSTMETSKISRANMRSYWRHSMTDKLPHRRPLTYNPLSYHFARTVRSLTTEAMKMVNLWLGLKIRWVHQVAPLAREFDCWMLVQISGREILTAL